MPQFAKLTSPQIGALAEQNALRLIPVGQLEEHGRHLPVGTDTAIAAAVVEAAEQRLHPDPPTVSLPPIWTGYSGKELAHWPGRCGFGHGSWRTWCSTWCAR